MNYIKKEIEVKKSKFISYYYEVTEIDTVKKILEQIKKEHKKARHIPYSYKIGNLERKSDDKEPQNTAGMPIYNIIKQKELDNVLIIVVRYFGGTKLGAGGLYRAYQNAVLELFK